MTSNDKSIIARISDYLAVHHPEGGKFNLFLGRNEKAQLEKERPPAGTDRPDRALLLGVDLPSAEIFFVLEDEPSRFEIIKIN